MISLWNYARPVWSESTNISRLIFALLKHHNIEKTKVHRKKKDYADLYN